MLSSLYQPRATPTRYWKCYRTLCPPRLRGVPTLLSIPWFGWLKSSYITENIGLFSLHLLGS